MQTIIRKPAVDSSSNTDPTLEDFSTTDIYLASVLKTAGFPLLKMTSRYRKNSTGGIFHFPNSEKIQETAMKYLNGDLRLDPRALFETWKTLKALAASVTGEVR